VVALEWFESLIFLIAVVRTIGTAAFASEGFFDGGRGGNGTSEGRALELELVMVLRMFFVERIDVFVFGFARRVFVVEDVFGVEEAVFGAFAGGGVWRRVL
jgi:hypothetical protein